MKTTYDQIVSVSVTTSALRATRNSDASRQSGPTAITSACPTSLFIRLSSIGAVFLFASSTHPSLRNHTRLIPESHNCARQIEYTLNGTSPCHETPAS